MVNDIRFKSYCWSIGTTSYRTDNFNMNIERQLALMKEFRRLPANRDKSWSGNNKFQAEYYAFLKEKNFVKGDAPRPDKDAREKTSGLKISVCLMKDAISPMQALSFFLYLNQIILILIMNWKSPKTVIFILNKC